MIITSRLQKIVNFIEPCNTLFDVGCDHGYVSKLALESGLCRRVVLSDISKPSLLKAEKLLSDYFPNNAESVVCDGLPNFSQIEQAVICGMGGEVIVKILAESKVLPHKLVLQPMKNTKKVREILFKLGYGIKADLVYRCEGKFYDFVVAEKGLKVREYEDNELEYGRDNLLGKGDFMLYLEDKIARLKRRNTKNSKAVEDKIIILENLKNGIK